MWRQADGRSWAETARDPDAFYIRVPGFVAVRVTHHDVHVDAEPSARASTIRHLLLDQVLPLALSAEGHLVLHASAVHRDGFGVIACTGAAGSGKSTLAAALAQDGWVVVSDDGLLVQQAGEKTMAIPAYAGLRMWPDAVEASGMTGSAVTEVAEYSAKLRVTFPRVPAADRLRAVYAIERGGAIDVEPLGPGAAAMALIAHAYRAEPHHASALTAQLDACAAIAARVPVYRVSAPDDIAQLADVARTLTVHATVETSLKRGSDG